MTPAQIRSRLKNFIRAVQILPVQCAEDDREHQLVMASVVLDLLLIQDLISKANQILRLPRPQFVVNAVYSAELEKARQHLGGFPAKNNARRLGTLLATTSGDEKEGIKLNQKRFRSYELMKIHGERFTVEDVIKFVRNTKLGHHEDEQEVLLDPWNGPTLHLRVSRADARQIQGASHEKKDDVERAVLRRRLMSYSGNFFQVGLSPPPLDPPVELLHAVSVVTRNALRGMLREARTHLEALETRFELKIDES